MSDFYQERRSSIRGVTSYVAFFVGLALAGPYAWTLLRADVEGYEFARGVFRFIVVLLGAGTAFGIVGLGLGSAVGWVWERLHQRSRGSRASHAPRAEEPAHAPARDESPHFGAVASARAAAIAAASATANADVTIGSIRYSDAGFDVKEFVALAQHACAKEYTPAAAGAALRRTINIGAWENGQLVAAVRVLTDGQTFAMVPEVFIRPDCRRRGIGRELMQRAVRASPGKRLHVSSAPETLAFFEQLGAKPSAFGLRLTGRAVP